MSTSIARRPIEYRLLAAKQRKFDGIRIVGSKYLVRPQAEKSVKRREIDRLRQSAFAVAIWGKADMAFCGANVCF
jgi:hypothetical protein